MNEKEKMVSATAATENSAKRPYVKPQTEIIELEPANAVTTHKGRHAGDIFISCYSAGFGKYKKPGSEFTHTDPDKEC